MRLALCLAFVVPAALRAQLRNGDFEQGAPGQPPGGNTGAAEGQAKRLDLGPVHRRETEPGKVEPILVRWVRA